MKNFFKNSVRFAMIALVALFPSRDLVVKAASLDPMIFSISLPTDLQPSVVRQDFENESIFSFKNGNTTAFLFSVTRVTGQQWLTLSHQVKNAMVVRNDGDYVYFVQKTDQIKIKGSANDEYLRALNELDAIIAGIQFNS